MPLPIIAPAKTRFGWIGTGIMGVSMCSHLMRAGFQATVFNRTPQKAQSLLQQGAAWADSPRAVAEAADVVFTMVGYPADVRNVILGSNGVLSGCRLGMIVVDMTTSEPSLAIEIAAAALAKGVYSIDAPVSGGETGAREARLSIMIGGDAAAVEALRPCWEAMGKTIVRQGGPGAGQHAKLVNQILLSGTMVSLCEALLYAYRAQIGSADGLAIGFFWGCRELVVNESRATDHRQSVRSRLLRRTLHQRHGDRTG